MASDLLLVSLSSSVAPVGVDDISNEKGELSISEDAGQLSNGKLEKPFIRGETSGEFSFPNSFLSNGLLVDSTLDPSLWDTIKAPIAPLGPTLTLRSFVVGSLVTCLGAAIYQVYVLKPVLASVSSTFLVMVVYMIGAFWDALLPQHHPSVGKLPKSGWFLQYVNPGPVSLGEHAVASMIAIAGANGSLAVQTLSVQYLYYDGKVETFTALLLIFSTTCFGCAIAGLFRQITISPRQFIYPTVIPILSLLRAFHNGTDHQKPLRWFSIGFAGMFAYEILPAYLFPLLNGLNIFCLASQSASSPMLVDAFTSLFGGASGNEGLGLFSFSFDWQFIGSSFMHLPINYQVNVWLGYMLCYAAVMGIYYSNVWNAFNLPILSTTIFTSDGAVYNQTTILDGHYNVIPDSVQVNGLPSLTGSFLWANIASNLGVGSLIAHACCFVGLKVMYPFLSSPVPLDEGKAQSRASKSLDDVPNWVYTILAILAFFAGLTVVLRQQVYIPQASYLVALVVGIAATPFANALNAQLGHWLLPTHVAKMVGGLVLPGNPLGILYFSTWSESTVSNAMLYTTQLKLAQYLNISARLVLFTQIWGLLLGALVNYGVMTKIVEHQVDSFISALGTNIWNGQVPQILNSEAVTWSLAKELYSTKGPYFIVPLSLLLGAGLTVLQAILHWCFPRLWFLDGNNLMLPVVFMYSSIMTFGITSSVITSVLIGLVSRLWLRYRHTSWYDNQSVIFASGLDGGAQAMLLVLSFTVLGGIEGAHRPFIQWAGNPVIGNVDYCNGNGALS